MAKKGDPARRERFACLLAQGLMTDRAAAAAAGFSPGSGHLGRLKKDPEFAQRVADLKHDAPLVGPDLAPVILRLFHGAEKAMTIETGGAFAAAARMLVEAARLKRVDGPGGPGAQAVGGSAPPQGTLPATPPKSLEESLDEWAARWAPGD